MVNSRTSMFGILALSLLLAATLFWLRRVSVRNQDHYLTLKSSVGRPASCSTTGQVTVRVLSQNLWAANFWAAEKLGSKGPNPRARFDGFVRSVTQGKYDVLLLQELFVLRTAYFFATVDDVAYLTKLLEKAGFLYHTDLLYNLPSTFGQSSGVAIFSKYPITEWKGHTFNHYSVKESITSKGFVRAQISIGRSHVNFFSTHMDSSGWEPGVKLEQIKEVGEALKKVTSGASQTAIVAGDFNIDSLSPEAKEHYDHLLSTMKQAGVQPIFNSSTPTYHTGTALDHAFIGGGNISPQDVTSKAVVKLQSTIANLPVSDHYGIFFEVKLREDQVKC
ncbi:sphingomyelinase C-like [Sycon ciliatum]|uniref:sphingomyelinase C-like n=1 Tax=Sycon ciliatum TaxID=27933 RepID=UPI0020AE838D|eukprot:scpid69085/ scgid17738/ Phospholipase C; Beta-hemolysin; Beta-toxin; Sphingomyelinase; Phospholipase C; Beta-hemolysin; Beta-toxin; Sphingomyelinase; Phospholipase C; Beta-hemolysin; Beta-toxin; Sphingomyelinase